MDYKEIIKLLDAGYSREDILQMQEGTGADEGAEAGADEGAAGTDAGAEGANELNAAIKDMKDMFKEFTKEITAMNIMNSRQSADTTTTAEEILANIINPTTNKKEGENHEC